MSSYQSAVDQLLRRGFSRCLGDWGSVRVCPLESILINFGILSGHHYANLGKDTRSLQAFLGHRNIQSTVRYTSMAPNRF